MNREKIMIGRLNAMVLATVVGFVSSSASAAFVGYDPFDTDLPAAPFSLSGTETIIDVTGGFATTSIGPSSGSYIDSTAAFSNATGWTVDTRFQIDPTNSLSQRAISLLIREPGGGQLELEVMRGSFFLAGEGAGIIGGTQIATLDDGYHTLRVARLGNNVQVFLDSNAAPLVNATFSKTQDFGGNFLFWGRVGGDSSGKASVDYLQYDNTQALFSAPGNAPGNNVPEPASLALLTAGAVMTLGRKRR
jgi:PEP-CTERM motif-containing protein